MRFRFSEQLQELNTELITMGSLCEEAISCSVKCLTDGESAMRTHVAAIEREIDQKERDIESLCMRLLLMQQPVAGDLRSISSAMRMISDMERIGDQAADISEISAYFESTGLRSETHITDMARATIGMVTDSVDSFVKKDAGIARDVIAQDDRVDELFCEVKQELIDAVGADPGGAEALIDLLMIAKYFERIGDHAVNIAEWVIYSIEGHRVGDAD